jgi:DNA polymerase-1
MAVLYRAFYAIPDLATKAGKPTNAVFGFVRMLRQIAAVWAPSHWAVAFDGGLPEKRVALLEAYKAQRKPMPDALREQIPVVEEYLDKSGVTRIRQDRQEADDIMATLAAQAEPEAERILLATGDKDMFQLVNERVNIIPVAGKNAVSTAMGPDAVRAKTGVGPDQIAEWLALTGDASDNIPGVPGVGEKTAAKLLGQYGSLESVFGHLDQIASERIRGVLAEHDELILRNLEMVSLRRDLDCPLEWDRLRVRNPDVGTLMSFFEACEFHSLARELSEQSLFPGK